MRRLLSFACEGSTLGATLDDASGSTGVLIVTGGSQTRVGAHRSFERLAAGLAAAGHPVFRYDRRGVGDSEGEDPGFRGSEPDLRAAVRSFRAECPVQTMIGFGLCDGATALALFGADAGLDGLILANPWFIEAESGEPPPAAIRQHYRERLLSVQGWRKLLSGRVSYRKLIKGIRKSAKPARAAGLAAEVAASLERRPLPVALILAKGDATAIAAQSEWWSARFRTVRERLPEPILIDTDAHTFAKSGDKEKLLDACLAALGGFGPSGRF